MEINEISKNPTDMENQIINRSEWDEDLKRLKGKRVYIRLLVDNANEASVVYNPFEITGISVEEKQYRIYGEEKNRVIFHLKDRVQFEESFRGLKIITGNKEMTFSQTLYVDIV